MEMTAAKGRLDSTARARMQAEKREQLAALLRAIPPSQAVALARAVEAMQHGNAGDFPADIVLDALAPALAAARRERYMVRPLVLAALEPFLAEDETAERAPGLIARSVVEAWWKAAGLVAPNEFAALQAELDILARRDDEAALAECGVRARAVAAGAAAEILAQLKGGKAIPAIRNLAKTPEDRADAEQIAEILRAGEKLRTAIETVVALARRDGKMPESVILDLSAPIVTETKRCYERLSEGDADGSETRLLALAILNRLDKPWHIFRLARALSWKRDASLVSNTELAVIGQRILHDLDMTASIIDSCNPRGRMSAHLVDFDRLHALVARYVDCAEGLLGEIDLRRDSAWGEAMLRSRGRMRDALERDRLESAGDIILAVLPERAPADTRQRPISAKAGAAAPSAEAAMPEAAKAIQLLTFIAQRASRQGFGGGARELLEEVCQIVDERGEALIADLRAEPENAELRTQLATAIWLVEALFQDERGKILLRRLKNELGGEAAQEADE
jgi:hypothetical protein